MSKAGTVSYSGPIGVFDSGVGGLSVVRSLLHQLPNESLLYVADAMHCPYGTRSEHEIQALSEGISRFLLAEGAKVLVVACNTASAAALAYLRERLPETSFVGVVPAVKPAVEMTRSGIVGVLATPVTFHGRPYVDVVEHFGAGARVLSTTCAGLVERVEAGDLDGPEPMSLLRACVDPLLRAGADTLVLGCTHYPFLIPALRRIVGDDVQLVEPSEAIAAQTIRVLRSAGRLAPSDNHPKRVYATTGEDQSLTRAIHSLLGEGPSTSDVARLRWCEGRLEWLAGAVRPEPAGPEADAQARGDASC